MAKVVIASLLLFVAVSGAWATGVVEPGSAGYFLHTGLPVLSKSFSAHSQGHVIQVDELVSAIHQMNVGTGNSLQPIDLEVHFLLEEDPISGHAAYCRSTFQQVQIDEQNVKQGDRAVPYFQITVDRSYPQITTAEGLSLYQDRALSCWEVMDPKPSP
jgi:hypothetical protein